MNLALGAQALACAQFSTLAQCSAPGFHITMIKKDCASTFIPTQACPSDPSTFTSLAFNSELE